MHGNRSFVKKTKGGRVVKVVREHYLRDDIYVGCAAAAPELRGPDPEQWKLSADAARYVVIDTNVALHQLDLLAHAAVTDVVVLSVVLDECRARSKASYERLRAMCQDPAKRFFVFANEHHRQTHVKAEPGESPNDRNDRAIRVATKFYQRALPNKRVVLLTNDRGNLAKAREDAIDALSCREFAAEQADQTPDLADVVAPSPLDDSLERDDAGGAAAPSPAKRRKTTEDARPGASADPGALAKFAPFAEHLTPAAIASGVKGGTLHQGAMRTSRFTPWEGRVSSDAIGAEILIVGRANMNRSVDGDVVAVRLLPESEWRKPNDKVAHEAKGEEAGDPDAEAPGSSSVALAPRTAEEAGGDAPADAPAETSGAVPTGVVVGIARRSWRERGYAASIDVGPNAAGAAAIRAASKTRARAPRPRGSWPCRWTVAFRRSGFRRARRRTSSTSESSSSWTSGRGTRPTPRGTTCARSVRSATWTRRRRRFCSRRTWTTARSRPRCTRASLPCLGVSTRRRISSNSRTGRTCGSFACAPWTRPGVGTSTTR